MCIFLKFPPLPHNKSYVKQHSFGSFPFFHNISCGTAQEVHTHIVLRLHDGLDLHRLALLELLEDRPVLVGRAVRVLTVLSTLITLTKRGSSKRDHGANIRGRKERQGANRRQNFQLGVLDRQCTGLERGLFKGGGGTKDEGDVGKKHQNRVGLLGAFSSTVSACNFAAFAIGRINVEDNKSIIQHISSIAAVQRCCWWFFLCITRPSLGRWGHHDR